MTQVNRRTIVKYAAAAVLTGGVAKAQTQPTTKPADALLAQAKLSPEGFMLSKPEVFTLETDAYSRDLLITSARDEQGNRVTVYVPSNCVRIFRADTGVDEFTRQGGLYWSFRDQPGKVKLPPQWQAWTGTAAGQLVMVVREEETVRLYNMMVDLRC